MVGFFISIRFFKEFWREWGYRVFFLVFGRWMGLIFFTIFFYKFDLVFYLFRLVFMEVCGSDEWVV